MTHLSFAAVLLATAGPDPDDVTAGWPGFLVFLGLAVAVVLLWLSFRKQLKKIDFEEEPDQPESDSEEPGPEEPGSSANGSAPPANQS
jgi:hypothetical protein